MGGWGIWVHSQTKLIPKVYFVNIYGRKNQNIYQKRDSWYIKYKTRVWFDNRHKFSGIQLHEQRFLISAWYQPQIKIWLGVFIFFSALWLHQPYLQKLHVNLQIIYGLKNILVHRHNLSILLTVDYCIRFL